MGRFLEVINNTKDDFSFAIDNSKDPDKFAADQDLAGQTGLPVDYVERNRDEAEKVKKQNVDFSRFADMELGASLTDPAFSNLAQDDLDNLSYLEKTFKGLGTTISESFKQGAKGVALSAIEDGAKPATAGMMPGVYDPFVSDIFEERNPGLMGDVKQAAAGIAIESIKENEEAIKAVTPEGLDIFQKGFRGMVQSVSANAPGLAASMLTKSTAPMLTSMGIQSYGSAYGKARSSGLSPEQSYVYGTTEAGIEILTEMIPSGKLIGLFGGRSGKDFVKYILSEAKGETIATFLSAADTYFHGIDEELNAAEAAGDYQKMAEIQLERQAVTLITAGLSAGVQGGISAGVGKAADKLSGNKQQLQDMVASAEQSNLKRRSPEQFRSFLQTVDPLANVFVPASAFEGVQLDPSNKTLAQVAAQLPQARALNGDVVIPVADVLTDIPADMFSQVAPFVRVEADGVAEIEVRPDMKELIEQVNRESEMATQSKAFQKDLSSQLVATARARPDEATKYAAVVGARLETLAVDKGMTFDEAVKEYIGELRVVGPDVPLTGENVMEQAKTEGYEGSDQTEAAEWVSAKAKGLDMSQAARMQRAAEQGFDTGKVWYRGQLKPFEEDKIKNITWFTDSPEYADSYTISPTMKEAFSGENITQAYLNKDKRFDFGYRTLKTDVKKSDVYERVQGGILEAYDRGLIDKDKAISLHDHVSELIKKSGNEYKKVYEWYNEDPEIFRIIKESGFDHVTTKEGFADSYNAVGMLYPERIRSVNAAFDPAQKESPNLLAQSVYHGTPHRFDKFSAINDELRQAKEFAQKVPQTETAEFKNWFGDSKVVDENGNPLVVYHGTNATNYVPPITKSGSSSAKSELQRMAASYSIEDWTSVPSIIERWVKNPVLAERFGVTQQVADHVRELKRKATAVEESPSRNDLAFDIFALPEDGNELGVHLGTKQQANTFGVPFQFYLRLKNPIRLPDLGNWNYQSVMREVRKKGVDISESEYSEVFNARNNNAALRELLLSKGIDGVIYKNEAEGEGDSYIAFRPEQIKSATGNRGTFDPNDPSILNQKERGLISISDKEIVIKLTEASNRTTFLHESGHLFLEIESRIAAQDGISDGQRKMLAWLGVESFDQIEVEHHEKFARGFEAYAMEGRAPSKDLVEVFRSFARWLKKVYASMKQLDVELNDDIRQFFDRMLAADQAVKEAERLTQYKALFKDAKSAGMTEQEFADYAANQVRAQAKGGEELQSKLLKELTRQTEKWWKEELKAEKEKAAESLGKESLYQATSFLTGKTKIEGFDVHKMDIDAVKAMLPDGQSVPRQFRGMLAKGGLPPDEVAAMFDFASGQDLVNSIANSPAFNEAATAAANQAMIVKHGDILNDGSLQQEAQLAAHNEERGKLILAELRALNRKVGKETINRDALKFSAKEVIGRTPLKDIHPGKYRTAEVRSAREAATALAKKDYATAAQAKLKQAANFYLYREAMEAKQKEQSWRRYLAAVPNRKYSTKDVHPDYIKQMRLLASVYDFRRNPDPAQLSGIGTWIKAQQDAPDADIAPQVMDVNLAKAMEATAKGEPVQVKNYRDMTLDELQGVYDMVKHLRWVGGQLSENEKIRLQAEYEKVAKNIADKGGDIVEVPREPTKRSRALSGLRQFGQDHLALANQIEELDGFEQFGPAFNLIYQGVIDSSNTELKFRRETSEKVNAIFKEFGSSDFAEGKGEETITTEDGRKFTLSRRARVMLALYWGSPDSRTAIMDGDGLTVNDVNKMLATLTDQELDLVDSIWKLNESFWPELARVSKAMTGIVPAKVEHVPFAVNGRVMSGGYMRLFYMYDQRDSVQTVDTEGAKITRSGARIVTQTKHGARHERVGSGGRKVDLNVNNVFRALDEVIHDISFAETARSVTRAMRNPEVSGAIINHYGKEKYESITSSLEGIIAGNVSNSHPINNFIKHFRTAATYGMLGYSLRNAVQQPVALTNMFGRIGEVETIGAMYDFIVNRNKWGKFVQDRSEFMKNRTSLVNREVAEIMGKISGNVMSSGLKQHAFDLQTIGDSMIAYPGWLAAYRKGLKEFGSEQKAIIYADESVSATIGSGLMKDMSPMLQGSGRLAQTVGPEMLKSITFMGSYFNVIGRLIYSATKQADFKSVRGVASYTRTMTWYLAAPAILSALLVGQGPDDDESWLAWSAKAIASYGFATVFMLRDLVSAASGFTPSSAWSRALDASIRASKGVYDVATGEKEGDKEDIAKILRSASYLYPLPGAGQAARTLEYIGSQEAGNEGDFNIYKAIVVGKDRD
jgi:hypothetical protein